MMREIRGRPPAGEGATSSGDVSRTPGRTQRLRLGVAAILVAFLLAAGGSAAAEDLAAESEVGYPTENAPVSDGPLFDAQQDADEQRLAQAEAERSSPQAAEERSQSKTEYADLSDEQALDQATDIHPDTVLRIAWRGLELDPGAELAEVLGPTTARIDNPIGPDGLYESTLPIRAYDEKSGKLELLDPTLERWGGYLQPSNPLVETRIADVAGEGIALPNPAISMYPAPADSKATAQVVAGKAWFSNVLTDTDYLAVPLPTGVQILYHLRSIESPEALEIDFDLPKGAQLRGTSIGGAEIVEDGETSVSILPPAAWDAGDHRVPARYVISDSSLSIEVPHREKDLLYPLVVDPVIDAYGDFSPGGCGGAADQGCWQVGHDVFGADHQLGYQNFYAGVSGGLYVGNFTSVGILDGEWTEWYTRAYPHTFIERVDFQSFDLVNPGAGANMCYRTGIWHESHEWQAGTSVDASNGAQFGSPVVYCGPFQYATEYHWVGNYSTPDHPSEVQNGEGVDGNVVAFALEANGDGWRTAGAYNLLRGAAVYRYDRNDPSISGVPGSSGWVDDSVPGGTTQLYVTTPTIADQGLGAKSVALAGPGVSVSATHPCSGARASRCPTSWQPSLSYRLPQEGLNTVTVSGQDVISRSALAQSWTQRIDRTAPNVALSGSLWDRRGQALATGSYSVTASGTDGSNATPQTRQSGVKNLVLTIDGATYGASSAQAPSGDSAPMSRSWTIDEEELDPGRHDLVVTATDQVNHTKTEAFSIWIDSGLPNLDVGGDLEPQADGTYEVEFSSADQDVDEEAGVDGTGVDKVEVLIDGQVVHTATSSCAGCPVSGSHTYTLPSGQSPQDHVVVRAVDRAGNQRPQSVQMKAEVGYNDEYILRHRPPITSQDDFTAEQLVQRGLVDGNGRIAREAIHWDLLECSPAEATAPGNDCQEVSAPAGDLTIHQGYHQEIITFFNEVAQAGAGKRVILNIYDAPRFRAPDGPAGWEATACADLITGAQTGDECARAPDHSSANADLVRNAYGRVVSFLADRFEDQLTAIEVWNESNDSKFWLEPDQGPGGEIGESDANFFAALVKEASIETNGSGIPIIAGGMVRSTGSSGVDARPYLQDYFEELADIAPRVSQQHDGIGVHFYPQAAALNEVRGNLKDFIDSLEEDALERIPKNVPRFWITEAGLFIGSASSGPTPAEERSQRDKILRMYNLAKSRYEAFIVHKIVDAGNLQEGGVNDRLGNGSAQSPFAMRDRPAFCTLAGLWGDQVRPGYCDVTTPSTAIDSGPTATNDTTPTFAFSANEPSDFECRVDAASWAPCTSSHTVVEQAPGVHTFEVQAIDMAGNPDPTPASNAFTIDTTPPETTITSGPILLFGAQGTFTFSSSESGTFECRIDQQAWASCTSPHVQNFPTGTHTFEARARDTAGNIDPTPATSTGTRLF